MGSARRASADDQPGFRLGLSEACFPAAARRSAAEFVERCSALGVELVELSARTLERDLGAPVPTVSLEPPPDDGLELGLLELEEDVLRDAYELARDTFGAQLREWRMSAPLTPLQALRQAAADAGVAIELVDWPDLVALTDDELDYALRISQALGAPALCTALSVGGPRRLGPFARRQGARVSFQVDATASPTELEALFTHGPHVGAGISVGPWLSGGYGTTLALIGRHAEQISHLRLRDRRPRDGASGPSDYDSAPLAATLSNLRDRPGTIPVMIEVEAADDETAWAAAAQALGYWRSRLD